MAPSSGFMAQSSRFGAERFGVRVQTLILKEGKQGAIPGALMKEDEEEAILPKSKAILPSKK